MHEERLLYLSIFLPGILQVTIEFRTLAALKWYISPPNEDWPGDLVFRASYPFYIRKCLINTWGKTALFISLPWILQVTIEFRTFASLKWHIISQPNGDWSVEISLLIILTHFTRENFESRLKKDCSVYLPVRDSVGINVGRVQNISIPHVAQIPTNENKLVQSSL